jgi:hypothetical protein
MLLQGVQNVCCSVVKLISFEIYEQNTAKKPTIEDYLANFVITINTLRNSSHAAKKFKSSEPFFSRLQKVFSALG